MDKQTKITIKMRDFSTTLSRTDKVRMKTKTKTKKPPNTIDNISEMKNRIHKLTIINIYKTSHTTNTKCSLFRYIQILSNLTLS